MIKTTIDVEHGNGPSIALQYKDGTVQTIVFDETDEYRPVKAYRDGELVWEGDAQDAFYNLKDGDMGFEQ